MKKTIFSRTFSAIIIAVLLILIMAYTVTSVFAQNIYYANKMSHAQEVVSQISFLFDREDLTFSDFIYTLDDLGIEAGGRIIILDEENSMIYGGRPNSNSDEMDTIVPSEALELEKGINRVFKVGTDKKGQINHYLYAERLKNGMLVMVGIKMDSIEEAVAVLKRILMIVMFCACLIAVYAAYILSRNISVPLVRLNNLASEIGQLNFDVRYEGNREDEIGELGRTLNDLSSKLETNIKGLQAELEKEKNLQVLRKQFTAQASHEMQTPIAIIKSYLEAIEDGMAETEEEKEEYLRIIGDETDKMSAMVRSMMDLSQIESGTFTIKRKEFDIYGLLEIICGKYTKLAEAQGIDFGHSEIPCTSFMVYGDESRLEQVINNFISNAYKHAGNGGTASLEFRELSMDEMIKLPKKAYRAGIRISVWNQGEPISSEDMPYIWESFYKAKTLTGQKGTGLGLSISRSILQLHDYVFGVQNIEGGVEFWFEAPGRFEE